MIITLYLFTLYMLLFKKLHITRWKCGRDLILSIETWLDNGKWQVFRGAIEKTKEGLVMSFEKESHLGLDQITIWWKLFYDLC